MDPADHLYEHVKGMRRFAMALVGNGAEADDLVQESLHRVLVAVRAGRKIENLRAYLYSTLRNIWIDRLSRATRQNDMVSLEDAKGLPSLPAGQVAQTEWREMIERLDQLPTEQRDVLLLVGLEGFSYQDAAHSLGVPIGTIMSRLSRGREALRRLMDVENRGEAAERRAP